jgi:hypothetical protein
MRIFAKKLIMLKNIMLSTLFISLLVACTGEQKCKYKPEPIFSKDLKGVQQYNFEKYGTQSLESVFFENNILLELHQDVCDQSSQEYKFTVKGDYSAYPDSLWLKEAVRQLTYLSTLSPKQAALKEWAGIIEVNRKRMKLAESTKISSGIYAKVDRVLSPEQSILILTLESK